MVWKAALFFSCLLDPPPVPYMKTWFYVIFDYSHCFKFHPLFCFVFVYFVVLNSLQIVIYNIMMESLQMSWDQYPKLKSLGNRTALQEHIIIKSVETIISGKMHVYLKCTLCYVFFFLLTIAMWIDWAWSQDSKTYAGWYYDLGLQN